MALFVMCHEEARKQESTTFQFHNIYENVRDFSHAFEELTSYLHLAILCAAAHVHSCVIHDERCAGWYISVRLRL